MNDVAAPMRAFTKLVSTCAGALFVSSFVFAFLGADSVERPATKQLMSASGTCMLASVFLLVVRLSVAIAQKRRSDL
jgi:hypothetical protein